MLALDIRAGGAGGSQEIFHDRLPTCLNAAAHVIFQEVETLPSVDGGRAAADGVGHSAAQASHGFLQRASRCRLWLLALRLGIRACRTHAQQVSRRAGSSIPSTSTTATQHHCRTKETKTNVRRFEVRYFELELPANHVQRTTLTLPAWRCQGAKQGQVSGKEQTVEQPSFRKIHRGNKNQFLCCFSRNMGAPRTLFPLYTVADVFICGMFVLDLSVESKRTRLKLQVLVAFLQRWHQRVQLRISRVQLFHIAWRVKERVGVRALHFRRKSQDVSKSGPASPRLPFSWAEESTESHHLAFCFLWERHLSNQTRISTQQPQSRIPHPRSNAPR